ncbi:MAG TPA: hypothetical protein V6C96_00240, partial [Vampirovibrionales bacterium]
PIQPDYSEIEYFLIVMKQSRKYLTGFHFSMTEDYKDVLAHSLSELEKNDFKDNIKDFTLVENRNHGKVYEHKNSSFRSEYNRVRKPNRQLPDYR